MPKVKDIGLGKHLSKWDKERKKEQARKEKIAKYNKKAEMYRAKTKERRAKSAYKKSGGKRRLAWKGVTLSSFFKKHK